MLVNIYCNVLRFCIFSRIMLFGVLWMVLKPVHSDAESDNVFADAFVDSINSMQSSCTSSGKYGNCYQVHAESCSLREPERNLYFDSVVRVKKSPILLTVKREADNSAFPLVNDTLPNLPVEFDSRTRWPFCQSISEISDQASCGSCWAVSAVDAMTDRACIHSNGKLNFRFSSANVINCCKKCGKGCRGGFHRLAWKYWVEVGIVSGGPFNSETTCQPYQFPPCEHHMRGSRPNCTKYSYTPPCRRLCQSKYNVTYKDDLHFGKSAYSIANNELAIRTEIYRNGPVQGSMELYFDLYAYKSGVYQHLKGRFIDIHAVRIIGWGIDNKTNVPYWLVANSFNYDWGENGFFKVKRGSNECLIENDITAGIPRDYI